jgi:hypothetical protein
VFVHAGFGIPIANFIIICDVLLSLGLFSRFILAVGLLTENLVPQKLSVVVAGSDVTSVFVLSYKNPKGLKGTSIYVLGLKEEKSVISDPV